MATLQKLPQSSTNTTLLPQSSTDTALLPQSEVGVTEQFPAGLKVLVVDDDSICLKILEKMLRRCLYDVTTCSQATFALKLLRERKGFFDMVLSDVHMLDMDGFKLLEHVGFEMDLPVIMMSADGRTSAVMKGIRHGACDYLIKPIREEELKNIWQHVVRKKWNENKENEHSGGFIDNDRPKQGSDHTEYASSAIEGAEGIKLQKKKRDGKEDDVELENDDPTTSKKPRVVWSVELHQQFVSAVNQLGIDKAVPKRILELMNVPGLTRENVASHLQKFRLYLKRLSGVAQQQGGIPNTFYGHMEQNPKPASLGRIDMQALASSGQISPQTLAALHSELLGWSSGNLAFPTMDQSALLQASLQAPKCLPVDHGAAYGQLLTKCPSNTSKTFSHSNLPGESAHSLVGALPSSIHGAIGFTSNFVGLDSQNGNILMGILQQQPCQQVDPQQQKQAVLLEPSSSINVQPSCLVVPSQPRSTFQSGHKPASVSQICNFNSGSIIDYSLPASQSNNSSFYVGRMMDGDFKSSTLLNNYADPYTISPSVSSCSMNAENGIQTFTSTRHTGIIPNICDMQGSDSSKSEQVIDRRMLRNIGFVGKGTTIPSRFAVDEPLSPVRNLNCGKTHADNNDSKLKQETNVDSMENIRVGAPRLQPSCQNDLTRVFSE